MAATAPALPSCARWNHIIMPTPGAPHWPESMCWWYTPLRIPSAPSTKSAGSCSPRPRRGKHSAGTGLPDRHPGSAGPCRQKTGYDTWFDALAAMEKQMDACDYEVAIIGAGAYGLPLAAHARDTGHVAIQMSGATQLLFGIKAAGGTPTPKSASCITLHGCAPPPPNSPPTSRRWRVAATGRTCAPKITL